MPRNTISSLKKLTFKEWLILFEIALLSVYIEIALRTVKFNRLLFFIARHRRRIIPHGFSDEASACAGIARLTRAVFRRYPLKSTCLKQSLALMLLLKRRGMPADFRIGISKPEENLSAHAWIEQKGQRLDEEDPLEYADAVFSLDKSK